MFAFVWDVFIDWGLGPQPLRRALRRLLTPDAPPSHHNFEHASWWLRPVRVFPTSWYVAGIVIDLVARLGWAVYISPGQTVVAQHVTLLLGSVELTRRAVWSLFRLEWEQILRVATEEVALSRTSANFDHVSRGSLPTAGQIHGPDEPAASLCRPLLSVAPATEETRDRTIEVSKEERIQAALKRNAQRMELESGYYLPAA